MNIANIVILLLIIAAGGIWLEVFLSKKESKWLGLILPATCLLFSIIAVMGVASYSVIRTEQPVLENGEFVNNVIDGTKSNGDVSSIIFTAISIFLLYNIPTVVLLAIYLACREKIKKNKELEKMNIQDLE